MNDERSNIRKRIGEEARSWRDTLKDVTGIELSSGEYLALRNYIRSYGSWNPNMIHFFMFEYFGLNLQEIISRGYVILGKDGKAINVERYGLAMLGDERFKQYCRNHVQEWRDERKLIKD